VAQIPFAKSVLISSPRNDAGQGRDHRCASTAFPSQWSPAGLLGDPL